MENNEPKAQFKLSKKVIIGIIGLITAIIILISAIISANNKNTYPLNNTTVNNPREGVIIGDNGTINNYISEHDSIIINYCNNTKQKAQTNLTKINKLHPFLDYRSDQDTAIAQTKDKLKKILNFDCKLLYLNKYEIDNFIEKSSKVK